MVLVPSIRFPTPWANCPNSLASDWYQVVLLGPAIRWQIFLKSTNGGVNDGIGLETVVESGYIGVSGADECWMWRKGYRGVSGGMICGGQDRKELFG